MSNEAHARIKINALLKDAGWRFFDDEQGPSNILLENHVKITQQELDAWGNDFERTKSGGIGFGSSEYFVLSPNKRILSTWIFLNVITPSFRERGKLNMTGTGGLQRVPPECVKSAIIPFPPIETQRQIITQIEKEQDLVNANKQLIEIFEQKIKDRIAKVWGADKKVPVVYKENEVVTMAAEE